MRGTLAAGKTTITKGIAHALGIEETITSPTFTIVSEYEGKLHLIEKFGSVRNKVDQIVSLTEEESSDENLQKIRRVSDEILEVL